MFMNIRNAARVKNYNERRHTPEFDEDYRRLFRFTRASVQLLATEFLEESGETRGGALSAVQRMEITLRYISDPGFQQSVGYQTGVCQSTVSKTVSKTLAAIVYRANNWIKFPSTVNEIHNAKEEWYQRHGFPSCIGCIDCTHVRIDKPSGPFGDEFVNRKNFPSINVQATCNSKWIVTSVDASWPGSVHDSRVFKNSVIYPIMLPNAFNAILLGDEGYGITPFLMTPYRTPATNEQRAFNNLHKKNRVLIEQCFGQIKRRFPILRYGIRLKMENISTCIVACFILHNIAKELNEPDFEIEDDFEEELQIEERRDVGNQLRIQGQNRRNDLADVIFNRYGII